MADDFGDDLLGGDDVGVGGAAGAAADGGFFGGDVGAGDLLGEGADQAEDGGFFTQEFGAASPEIGSYVGMDSPVYAQYP